MNRLDIINLLFYWTYQNRKYEKKLVNSKEIAMENMQVLRKVRVNIYEKDTNNVMFGSNYHRFDFLWKSVTGL